MPLKNLVKKLLLLWRLPMSSNHCFEFEFPAQIYKSHKQLLNKAWKGEQKNLACAVYIFLVWIVCITACKLCTGNNIRASCDSRKSEAFAIGVAVSEPPRSLIINPATCTATVCHCGCWLVSCTYANAHVVAKQISEKDCLCITLILQFDVLKHRHLYNNRLLILPPHTAPFLALICLIFCCGWQHN